LPHGSLPLQIDRVVDETSDCTAIKVYTKVQDLVPREQNERPASSDGNERGRPGSRPARKAKVTLQRDSGDSAATDAQVADFLPERSSLDDGADRVGVAPLGTPVRPAVPESYTELDEYDDATGLRWQERPAGPHKPPLPRKDDLDVLAALHELRFLTATQVHRRFMASRALRTMQHRLNQMFRVGWLRRCEITTGKRWHTQRIYALDRLGYELIPANRGCTELARLVDPDAKWRPPEVEDPRLILHDLHANAWLFALERLIAPNVLRGWRGPHRARLDVPGEKVRGQWIPVSPDTVPLGTGHHLADLQLDEFRPVRPDLAIELDPVTRRPAPARRLPDRARPLRPRVSNYDKFRRYDALLNGWAMALPRYKALGEPPIVVFIVEDDHQATQFLSAADRIMTGRFGKWGVPEAAWPAYGRRRTFVVSERDVHQGTLRARRLPEHPPVLRKALRGTGGARLEPEQVATLLPSAFLR
jgi:hypothetical protein